MKTTSCIGDYHHHVRDVDGLQRHQTRMDYECYHQGLALMRGAQHSGLGGVSSAVRAHLMEVGCLLWWSGV